MPTSRLRIAWWLLFGTSYLAHGWQCFRCVGSLAAIVDDQPIIQVDHAIHLYHGSIGSRFLKQHGVNWGYDPYFMAGYPKTPFHDPSAGLSDLCQLLAGGGYSPRAYKLGLLITMLTLPALLAIGGRWLGLSAGGLLAGTLLVGWEYWTGFSRIMLDSGLYTFLWASGWVVMTLGASNRWLQHSTFPRWLTMVALAGLGLFVHPTFGLMLAPGGIILYLPTLATRSWRWHAAVWLAGAVALAANLFWIVPMLRLWPLRHAQFHFMAGPADDAWYFITDHILTSPQRCVLLALAVSAIAVWMLRRQWRALGGLGTTIAALFCVTAFGSVIPALRGLEPYRFQTPLFLLSALAAGEALAALLGMIRFAGAPRLAWSLLLIGCCVGAGSWLWQRDLFEDGYARIRYHRPFPMGLRPPMRALVDWLANNTSNDHRIMLEDQLRLLEPTMPESLHWTTLLPVLIDRQFIGGHYQVTPLLHHHAAFGDINLANRQLDVLSDRQLREFVDRYNIGWVICWSPLARARFAQLEGFEPLGSLPRYTGRPDENRYQLFKVSEPSSYFAQGSGRVAAVDYNRIELADLQPRDGQIILKYHWLSTFRATPDVPLFRAPAGDDPVGFVGIRTDHPIERLVIANEY